MPSSPYIDADKPRPALSADEETLLSFIGADGALVDDVISAAGLPAGQVLAMLTMLEVKGVVARLPGKRVQRKI
jgi:predicted Rossmann fold nucleotide-binding protein DprA/Smf involved in DNA uptake